MKLNQSQTVIPQHIHQQSFGEQYAKIQFPFVKELNHFPRSAFDILPLQVNAFLCKKTFLNTMSPGEIEMLVDPTNFKCFQTLMFSQK